MQYIVEKINKAYFLYNEKNYTSAVESLFTILRDHNEIYENPMLLTKLVYNLSSILMEMGNYDMAFKVCNKFVLDKPYHSVTSEFMWNYSLASLHQNDNISWKNGMKNYKFRYLNDDGSYKSFPNIPENICPRCRDPKQVKGKVLVLNEQGFGDEIMFYTAINNFKNAVFSIQCYEELYPLFHYFYEHKLFTERNLSLEFVSGFDCWVPFGDLFAFSNYEKLQTIKPYSITNIDTSDNIGICVTGNPKSPIYEKRCININRVIDEFNIFDGTGNVISLQKDKPINNSQIDETEIGNCKNFYDTAKLVSSLKKVITCDTSVAHLCGLLGVDTVLIYNEYLDWRWKFENNISNIYPTVKLHKVV